MILPVVLKRRMIAPRGRGIHNQLHDWQTGLHPVAEQVGTQVCIRSIRFRAKPEVGRYGKRNQSN